MGREEKKVGGITPINDLLTDIAKFNQTRYTSQPNAGTGNHGPLATRDLARKNHSSKESLSRQFRNVPL